MKSKYRIKILEYNQPTIWNDSFNHVHIVYFYVNIKHRQSGFWKTSKKVKFKEVFTGENNHRDIMELQKVASGKLGESTALLYINHENLAVKKVARALLGINP